MILPHYYWWLKKKSEMPLKSALEHLNSLFFLPLKQPQGSNFTAKVVSLGISHQRLFFWLPGFSFRVFCLHMSFFLSTCLNPLQLVCLLDVAWFSQALAAWLEFQVMRMSSSSQPMKIAMPSFVRSMDVGHWSMSGSLGLKRRMDMHIGEWIRIHL